MNFDAPFSKRFGDATKLLMTLNLNEDEMELNDENFNTLNIQDDKPIEFKLSDHNASDVFQAFFKISADQSFKHGAFRNSAYNKTTINKRNDDVELLTRRTSVEKLNVRFEKMKIVSQEHNNMKRELKTFEKRKREIFEIPGIGKRSRLITVDPTFEP